MRPDVSRRRLLGGGTLTSLAALAGCLATGRGETETTTETYDPADISAVSLAAEDGAITVDGNRGDALEVRGHKAAPTEGSLESLSLKADREDDHLTVETAQEDVSFLFGPDPKLDLEAAVPEGIRVDHVATANGDIDVRDATGALDADTKNGRIDVRDIDGDAVAESTNGAVRVAGVSGDVRAETTNGSIDIGIEADGGDLTAESTNGSITVRAPPALDAALSLSTTNGEVSLEGFDDADAASEDLIEATLGDGSRRVRAETPNGDITVRSENGE